LARSLTEAFAPLYGEQWAGGPLTFPMLRQLPQQILDEMVALDTISKRILPALVEQLLGVGARASAWQHRPDWLRRATQFLESRCTEGIGVVAVARDAGVSPSRLAHGFRTPLGRTVGSCLRE